MSVQSGSVLPKAYKYKAFRTQYALERGASAWYLTECERVESYREVAAWSGVVTLPSGITESEVCRVFGQKLGFKVSQ